jgi:hypothetical protein
MMLGLLLVALLWTMAILAGLSRLPAPFVGVALLWGAVVVWLGLNQASLLPGDLHWLIQVLHLAVGVALIGQVEMLAGRILRSMGRVARQPQAATV